MATTTKEVKKKAKAKNKKQNKILKVAKIESLPKNIRQSIPITSVMADGTIETTPCTFTKTYKLEDVNFILAPIEEQVAIYKKYMDFLNSFNEQTRFQINIFNHKISKQDTIENIRVLPQSDGLNGYRHELNTYLLDNLIEGKNSITQDKYLTVSIKDNNLDHVMKTLTRVDNEVSNMLENICNKKTRPLSLVERMRLLYNIYNQDTDYRFDSGIFDDDKSFNLNAFLSQGLSIKDIIGPAGMDFSPSNHFKFGDTYGRVFYLDRVAPEMKPSFISDLAALSNNMLISITYEMLPMDKAKKIIKDQSREIRSQIEEKSKPTAANPLGGYVNTTLLKAHDTTEEYMNSLTEDSQKLFYTSVTVAIFADTKEELDEISENIKFIAKTADCPLKVLFDQQEFGINHCLPLCRNELFTERLFTTENAAVFIPYYSQELAQKNAVFYGLNQMTNSMILYDRHTGDNFNGLYLGRAGSGKSFMAKYELSALFLSRPNDQFFIIDPQGEFLKLAEAYKGAIITIAPGNGIYLNPLDMDLTIDKDDDPIATKVDFLLSMLDIITGQSNIIDATCKSIIDRVVRKIYRPYIEEMARRTDGKTIDTSICPTLVDLYQELKLQNNPAADFMANALEIYTVGSLNTFAHRTNIDTTARFIVYDTSSLGTGMADLGLHICCGDLWNRLKQNAKKDIWTNVYIDEMHLLLKSKTSAAFIEKLWKMARKWQGVLNGILQGASDLLYNDTEGANSSAILSNTSFALIMKSAFMERQIIAKLFSLSDSQMSYIDDSAQKGSGLLWNSKITLPFRSEFPKNTELYKLFTTSHDAA